MIRGVIPLPLFCKANPGKERKTKAPTPAPMVLKKKLRREIEFFIVCLIFKIKYVNQYLVYSLFVLIAGLHQVTVKIMFSCQVNLIFEPTGAISLQVGSGYYE